MTGAKSEKACGRLTLLILFGRAGHKEMAEEATTTACEHIDAGCKVQECQGTWDINECTNMIFFHGSNTRYVRIVLVESAYD